MILDAVPLSEERRAETGSARQKSDEKTYPVPGKGRPALPAPIPVCEKPAFVSFGSRRIGVSLGVRYFGRRKAGAGFTFEINFQSRY
jgi:hypothetical protein